MAVGENISFQGRYIQSLHSTSFATLVPIKVEKAELSSLGD